MIAMCGLVRAVDQQMRHSWSGGVVDGNARSLAQHSHIKFAASTRVRQCCYARLLGERRKPP